MPGKWTEVNLRPIPRGSVKLTEIQYESVPVGLKEVCEYLWTDPAMNIVALVAAIDRLKSCPPET